MNPNLYFKFTADKEENRVDNSCSVYHITEFLCEVVWLSVDPYMRYF